MKFSLGELISKDRELLETYKLGFLVWCRFFFPENIYNNQLYKYICLNKTDSFRLYVFQIASIQL